MKPKTVHGARGRPPKHKAFKKEMEEIEHEEYRHAGYQNDDPDAKPHVEIVSCISYQKFRYSGENRPGKKYQEKDFMELRLTNLQDKLVRVVIICTDAETKELIHPNGLVGKDCHDGIYDKEYGIVQPDFNIKIPYLRTERIKTKKNEHSKICTILKDRAAHLPSPYRERCESQCTDQYTNRKFDTTKVCLGVIVTVKSHFPGAVNGSLHAISHVVNNASEKTSLGILKLSNFQFSANKGGVIDIFTTEEGPTIEHEKYTIHVTYDNEQGNSWESEKFVPRKEDILYKRIITYTVPPIDLELKEPVEATLHLDCPQSNQSCESPIIYYPHNEGPEELVLYETQNLKRSFAEDLDDMRSSKQMRMDNSSVKAVLKESLKKRDKNNSAPSMEIIQTSHEAALVRRTSDPHLGPEEMDHASHRIEHSSHSHEQQNEQYQDLKILAAGYSNSVPSNTVLIVANDGMIPEDIENAISKASYHIKHTTKDGQEVIFVDTSSQDIQSSHQTITLDPTSKEIFMVPDSRSLDHDNKVVKEHSCDTSPPAKVHILQKQNENTLQSVPLKIIPTSMLSKKIAKTDSPWSVGYDDEVDLNLFHGLSFDKPPVVKTTINKHHLNHQVTSSQISHLPPNTVESSKSAPLAPQKTITVLSSMGKVINKETESYSDATNQGDNPNLDFSEFPLPSDKYLSSVYLSNNSLVKEINKDLPSLSS